MYRTLAGFAIKKESTFFSSIKFLSFWMVSIWYYPPLSKMYIYIISIYQWLSTWQQTFCHVFPHFSIFFYYIRYSFIIFIYFLFTIYYFLTICFCQKNTCAIYTRIKFIFCLLFHIIENFINYISCHLLYFYSLNMHFYSSICYYYNCFYQYLLPFLDPLCKFISRRKLSELK